MGAWKPGISARILANTQLEFYSITHGFSEILHQCISYYAKYITVISYTEIDVIAIHMSKLHVSNKLMTRNAKLLTNKV